MTARLTSRAGTKVGLSDPVVPHGRAIAQRIKATLGITGLSPPRVHIDGEVWHLDVGSSHPGAGAGPKGILIIRTYNNICEVNIQIRLAKMVFMHHLMMCQVTAKNFTWTVLTIMKTVKETNTDSDSE